MLARRSRCQLLVLIMLLLDVLFIAITVLTSTFNFLLLVFGVLMSGHDTTSDQKLLLVLQ